MKHPHFVWGDCFAFYAFSRLFYDLLVVPMLVAVGGALKILLITQSKRSPPPKKCAACRSYQSS
jgi:hypothetical protein